MSTLKADTLVASDGTSPVTLTKQSAAKAWACVDGTGTVGLRDSFNTTSVTDNGTGDYTMTFSSALSNDDFSHPMGSALGNSFANSRTTTTLQIHAYNVGGTQSDADPETFAIHGDLA